MENTRNKSVEELVRIRNKFVTEYPSYRLSTHITPYESEMAKHFLKIFMEVGADSYLDIFMVNFPNYKNFEIRVFEGNSTMVFWELSYFIEMRKINFQE